MEQMQVEQSVRDHRHPAESAYPHHTITPLTEQKEEKIEEEVKVVRMFTVIRKNEREGEKRSHQQKP